MEDVCDKDKRTGPKITARQGSRAFLRLTSRSIKREVFGFVGTNGSGKTTTIRNMMGFTMADRGIHRKRLDSWKSPP